MQSLRIAIVLIVGLLVAGFIYAYAAPFRSTPSAVTPDEVSVPVPQSTPVASVSEETSWDDFLTTMAPITDAKAAERIPPYPRGEVISTSNDASNHSLPPRVTYVTTDSNTTVTSFYELVLPRIGWTQVGSRSETIPGFETSTYRYFSWPDEAGTLPYRLQAHIAIHSGCPMNGTVEGRQAAKICIDVHVTRAPYASRVPIYPGAMQVTVSNEQDEVGDLSRVTKYVARATPLEIFEYYESELPEYGWVPGIAPLLPEYGGTVSFEDPANGPEATNTVVTITTKDLDNGETHVIVHAQGSGLDTPQELHK